MAVLYRRDGAWTYILNTDNEDVAGLEVESRARRYRPTSVDGIATFVMRITALTQVAEIRNTINVYTGELRFDLDPHQLQGKLAFSFLKTEALADDGNQKDAYITLYGSSGSSSESLVDLRIQGSATNDDGSPVIHDSSQEHRLVIVSRRYDYSTIHA